MKEKKDSDNISNLTNQNLIKKDNFLRTSFILNLNYWSLLNTKNEINNKDPIYKLTINFDEIETISKTNKIQITKFFYFNREKISKILFDLDKIIHIKYYNSNKNISFYFYLLLLINNSSLLDYTYDGEYINEILNEEKNDDPFYKIIISKIIINLLIDFQKNNDFYEEAEIIKIKKYIDDHSIIIKKYIDNLNEIGINWNENDIITKRIDDLYIEIIISLIKQKKIGDYEFTDNIMAKLDLENISLTKEMMDELIKILNNKEYTNEYIISKEEDLSKENKINFYYIIFKYLIKDNYFIYQIPFLFKTMVFLKKLINKKQNKILLIKNFNNIIKKIKSIFVFLIGTDKNIEEEKIKSNLINILTNCINDNEHNYTKSNSSNFKTINSKNEEICELNCIIKIKDLISKDEIKNEFIKEILEKKEYDFDKIIKSLNINKAYENKFKEIITNKKFINTFKNEKILLFNKKLINEFFYFEEYINEINELKNNLPKNTNPKSIEIFRDWIKKEENNKSGLKNS